MDYIFKLSDQDAQIVINALAELPFRVSAPVIQKIQTQAAEQTKKDVE